MFLTSPHDTDCFHRLKLNSFSLLDCYWCFRYVLHNLHLAQTLELVDTRHKCFDLYFRLEKGQVLTFEKLSHLDFKVRS